MNSHHLVLFLSAMIVVSTAADDHYLAGTNEDSKNNGSYANHSPSQQFTSPTALGAQSKRGDGGKHRRQRMRYVVCTMCLDKICTFGVRRVVLVFGWTSMDRDIIHF